MVPILFYTFKYEISVMFLLLRIYFPFFVTPFCIFFIYLSFTSLFNKHHILNILINKAVQSDPLILKKFKKSEDLCPALGFYNMHDAFKVIK
jgi:hypothetical protein